MLRYTQLRVKAHLDKRLEYASIALIRTLSIKILCISLGNSALGINDIWQLEQHMSMKMDSLLIGRFA
jgi:hypothetical protein